eukprot:6481354-Amphidinium_carterae.1
MIQEMMAKHVLDWEQAHGKVSLPMLMRVHGVVVTWACGCPTGKVCVCVCVCVCEIVCASAVLVQMLDDLSKQIREVRESLTARLNEDSTACIDSRLLKSLAQCTQGDSKLNISELLLLCLRVGTSVIIVVSGGTKSSIINSCCHKTIFLTVNCTEPNYEAPT